MYYAKNTKCADCGNLLRIVYDSRDKGKRNICPCRKLHARLNVYGAMEYLQGGRPEPLPLDIQHAEKKDYPEDYVTLDPKTEDLLQDCIKRGYDLFTERPSDFTDFSNKYEIFLSIEGNDKGFNNYVTISCRVKLHDPEGFTAEERAERLDRVKTALRSFRSVLGRIEDGSLDLSKPADIWNNKELDILWDHGDKERLPHYEYKLFC